MNEEGAGPEEGAGEEEDRPEGVTTAISEVVSWTAALGLETVTSSHSSTLIPTNGPMPSSSSTISIHSTPSVSMTSPGDLSVSMATISVATFSISMSSPVQIPLDGVSVVVPLGVPLWFDVESAVVSRSLIISSSFPSSSSNKYIGIS